jgi:hypothetical protein
LKKLLKTQRITLAYLLIFSFIGWVNISSFPIFSQEQNPDAAARKLIETSQGLYQQGSFEDALNKLSEAAVLAQNREIKALADLEMAYVKFLQGRQSLIFRYHIEEALKLDPGIKIQERNYKPEFKDTFQAVKSGLIKPEKPEAQKPVIEKVESIKPIIKKRHFPWLGVVLSLAVVGWLVYFLVIVKNTLQVETVPAGANVYLDGIDTAKTTPCELKPSLGAHKIKLILNGYADVEREVTVKNGRNLLHVPLDIGTYAMSTPIGNANVQREAPCLISWDSSAMAVSTAALGSRRTTGVTHVDLELYQGDRKVADIARGVPNSGSYTWNVPATTAEGYDFKVRISCPGVPESSSFGSAFNVLGFKEDFEDNTANFWLADNAAAWNAAGGYYTAGKTTEKFAASIYDFYYSGSSYTVESKMRWSEFSGSNSAAPLFIMLGISKSFTGNAGYILGYGMDGTISIYQVENFSFLDPSPDPAPDPAPNPPKLIYSGSSSAVNRGLNNWNTVKVVRSGADYALSINNTLVYTFTDSTYNPVYVIIGFGGAGVKTTCDFDYVHMTVNH